MAIINARSPYYVSVTNASIAYATLDVYIWTGDKSASVPIDYSLKKNKHTTETKISFEIAELIRDDLDVPFDGNYTTSSTSDGATKWVKTIIKAFNSLDVQVGSTITETNLAVNGYGYFEEGSSFTMSNEPLFASEGDIFLPKFGDSNIAIYTEDNPTVLLVDSAGASLDFYAFTSSNQSDEQIKYVSLYPELVTNLGFDDATDWSIQSNDVIEDGLLYIQGQNGVRKPTSFVAVGGVNYILSYTITGYTSGTIAPFSGGVRVSDYSVAEGDYSVQFTQTANTNEVTFYSPSGFLGTMDNVSIKEVYEVAKISVTSSSKVRERNVKQVEDCKFTPHKVTFVNKNGVLDDMYFFKKSTNSMTTKRENYKGNTIKADNTYSINQHNKVDFNITANSMVKLSSGFLNESSNEKFKQLLLSEKVWITRTFKNSELVLPINIKTNDISYKTSLNNRLVEYSIEFNDSYNAINNIR
jgi:hypothetical protein